MLIFWIVSCTQFFFLRKKCGLKQNILSEKKTDLRERKKRRERSMMLLMLWPKEKRTQDMETYVVID